MNSVAAVIVVFALPLCSCLTRRFFHDWMNRHEQALSAMNASCKRRERGLRVVSSKKRELGTLIVQMLYYLGFEFNYVTTGASADLGFFSRVGARRGGQRQDERAKNGSYFFESDMIVVIDPVNAANNLGKSCFNVYQIKCLLRQTYQQLM